MDIASVTAVSRVARRSSACLGQVFRTISWNPGLTNSTPDPLDERANDDQQLAGFDRFSQVHVEPCPERLGAIFSPGVCRQCDGWNACTLIAEQANAADEFVAIDFRHADITHQ
jgi:hypothetical protein